jgi:hypothetical protein
MSNIQLNEAWRASEGIGYFYDEDKTSDLDLMQKEMDSIRSIPKVNENADEIDRLQRQIDSLKSNGN